MFKRHYEVWFACARIGKVILANLDTFSDRKIKPIFLFVQLIKLFLAQWFLVYIIFLNARYLLTVALKLKFDHPVNSITFWSPLMVRLIKLHSSKLVHRLQNSRMFCVGLSSDVHGLWRSGVSATLSFGASRLATSDLEKTRLFCSNTALLSAISCFCDVCLNDVTCSFKSAKASRDTFRRYFLQRYV